MLCGWGADADTRRPTPPARQGAASLGHVGLEAFVAEDAEDFQAKGLSWARILLRWLLCVRG